MIIINLYKIIILDNKKYSKALDNINNITYIGEKGIRGNIYDRNLNLLAGNKEVNIIVYMKSENITSKEEIIIAKKLSEVLDIDYSKVTIENIKEYYYIKNKDYFDDIVNKELKEKYNKNIISLDEYKEYIYSLITENKLSILTEIDKKSAYIYKLMNEGYSFEYKVIKNSNVSQEEISKIIELDLSGVEVKIRYERFYPYGEIFRELLGDLGKIPFEEKEYYLNLGYSLDDIVGISFLEKQYENVLKGINEVYKLTPNGRKEIISEAQKGNDIVLSIDIDLQAEVENIIYQSIINAKKQANTKYYDRSFVIVTDSLSGEILVSAGVGVNYINGSYQKINRQTDLINYSITPGSIVKAASHIVGYNNGAISFGTKVLDSCIKVLNTPKKCSWRSLGYIDDLSALKYSSNYYQFLIAIKIGNGKYNYNSPLVLDKEGFNIYRKVYNSFGLGVKTGVDLPNEQTGYRGNDTNTGSLLDFPIGQYDTYTPMSLLQYIMTLANNGTRIAPHYLRKIYMPDLSKEIYNYETKIMGNVETSPENISRVQEGLKQVMSGGTGYGYINLKYNPYGKTGTAQSFIDTDNDGYIDTETISSSFGAYGTYNDKNLSMIVLSPNVSEQKSSYISSVNSQITKKVSNLCFEK